MKLSQIPIKTIIAAITYRIGFANANRDCGSVFSSPSQCGCYATRDLTFQNDVTCSIGDDINPNAITVIVSNTVIDFGPYILQSDSLDIFHAVYIPNSSQNVTITADGKRGGIKSSNFLSGINIDMSQDCKVENVRFTKEDSSSKTIGVIVSGEQNIIQGNRFSGPFYHAIESLQTKNTVIDNNIIKGAEIAAIYVDENRSKGTSITNNYLKDVGVKSSYKFASGIWLEKIDPVKDRNNLVAETTTRIEGNCLFFNKHGLVLGMAHDKKAVTETIANKNCFAFNERGDVYLEFIEWGHSSNQSDCARKCQPRWGTRLRGSRFEWAVDSTETI